jgi:hypothetical protein
MVEGMLYRYSKIIKASFARSNGQTTTAHLQFEHTPDHLSLILALHNRPFDGYQLRAKMSGETRLRDDPKTFDNYGYRPRELTGFKFKWPRTPDNFNAQERQRALEQATAIAAPPDTSTPKRQPSIEAAAAAARPTVATTAQHHAFTQTDENPREVVAQTDEQSITEAERKEESDDTYAIFNESFSPTNPTDDATDKARAATALAQSIRKLKFLSDKHQQKQN